MYKIPVGCFSVNIEIRKTPPISDKCSYICFVCLLQQTLIMYIYEFLVTIRITNIEYFVNATNNQQNMSEKVCISLWGG